MKTALIQLELHDDIVSARDKMTWSKSPCILLVWPKRGHILRRLVDLVLIKRQGDQLGARVGLVTRDRVVISYAWEVGLPVFADTETALQIDWHAAPSSSPALASREKPVDLVELHREKDRLHRISPSIFEQIGWRLLFFTLAILSVLALALFFIPAPSW